MKAAPQISALGWIMIYELWRKAKVLDDSMNMTNKKTRLAP